MKTPMNLEWVLKPIEKQVFLDRYLEKKPLIIKREQHDYFEELLTIEVIDQWFSQQNMQGELALTLAHAERKIDISEYSNVRRLQNATIKTGTNFKKVFQLLDRDKATIILHETTKLWEPLKELTINTSNDLKCESGINVFVTPSQSQCFQQHYDENDLFILQIYGKKHWKIYESAVVLPLEPQNRKPVDFSNLKLLFEVELEEGDTLYVPRGFVHEVKTTEYASAHITLGLVNTTWTKLFTDYIVNLAGSDPAFRGGFATEDLKSDSGKHRLFEAVKSKIAEDLTLEKLETLAGGYVKAEEPRSQTVHPLLNTLYKDVVEE